MTTPTPEQPRFPMERESPYDPPPGILRLLREEPVSGVTLWDGHEAWLVTRYDDVRTLLTNPDLSADVRRPGYPKVSAALAHFTEGLLNHMDSPEHDVYRRMLAPDFMVKRVESLRGDVEKLLVTLAELLLIAGFDTTANMIALGTLTLLRHPAQLEELKADPGLWPGAVEELLRYLTITHRGRHRVATADIEVGGQLIRAGEGIIAAQD